MVNHLRTLLMNMAPGGSAPGECYVPPAFRPVVLPTDLAAGRRWLFGRNADRAGVNANLARLLAFLHASPLAPDVTAYDQRVSYDPARPAYAWGSVGPAAATVSGGDALGFAGDRSFRGEGRAYGEWAVSAEAGTVRVVTVGGQNYATDSPADGPVGSWAVPLPGSDLSVLVPADADGAWRVTLYAPPAYCFTAATGADPDAVFRPSRGGREEVWADTFAAGPTAAERAAAYALALAARVEAVRTTGRSD